jgi:hypothetical protein
MSAVASRRSGHSRLSDRAGEDGRLRLHYNTEDISVTQRTNNHHYAVQRTLLILLMGSKCKYCAERRPWKEDETMNQYDSLQTLFDWMLARNAVLRFEKVPESKLTMIILDVTTESDNHRYRQGDCRLVSDMEVEAAFNHAVTDAVLDMISNFK